jgi:endonuclease/exonuclease/phosphatase (EEP) superfamily protein YafD
MLNPATRRRTLDVGLALLAAPFPVWALARLFGLERGWPAVQLMAFAPQVAGAALAVAAVALLCRRWAPGAVAAVAAVLLVAMILPRVLADGGALPAGPPLRVLTANLLAGHGDERAVVDLVRRLDVDVLAVQEFTQEDADGFAAAGLGDLLPHEVAFPRPGTGGSALFSRHPLRDPGLRVHRSGFTQAHATVLVPGAPAIYVESVHPVAPSTKATTGQWRQDLAAQPEAAPNGPIRILAGDFNATLDHAALRGLIGTGYRDAAGVVGAGLRPTWPYDEKWYVPAVTLDRVLADARVGVREVRPYELPGSDHRALFAHLVLPPV